MSVTGGPTHRRELRCTPHLLFDVELDLSIGHVARTFHHHLDVVLQAPAGEAAEGFQLSKWRIEGNRGWQPRTQRITRETAVVALKISLMSSEGA